MRETIVGNVLSWLFGWGPSQFFDPMHQMIVIITGVLFGVFVIGLLILLGRWFFHWGFEEIWIRRGRDPFDRRLRRSSTDRRKTFVISPGLRRQRRLPTRRREDKPL